MSSRPRSIGTITSSSSSATTRRPSRLRRGAWVVIVIAVVLGGAYLDYAWRVHVTLFQYNEKDNYGQQPMTDSALSPRTMKETTAATATNQVDRSWCPEARCLSSPLCRPCQRRFLIIIANARSASTTLTWSMDLLPVIRMSGEINNALHHLRMMMKKTTDPPFRMKPPEDCRFSAWYRNPIPDGSFACVSQKLMETMTPPLLVNNTLADATAEAKDIVGFKTVRLFNRQNVTHVPMVAKFLKLHFPCARYFINYRSDVEKQVQSVQSTFKKDDQKATSNATALITSSDIFQQMAFMMELHDQLGPQRSRLLDSAEWTKNVSMLNDAVRWLGFNEWCAFPGLLQLNTGRSIIEEEMERSNDARRGRIADKEPVSKPGFQHTVTHIDIDPRCRYVGGHGGG